ncbi:hypothetical protein GW17_00020369, partial [Ensete ventricosum]
ALSTGEGRPYACCLQTEVAGHGQAPCRSDRPWLGYLQGATTRGHDRLRPACKGLPPAASPAANRGGSASRRGGRPLAGWLPIAKGNRRLRRGSGDDGAVRVKEG